MSTRFSRAAVVAGLLFSLAPAAARAQSPLQSNTWVVTPAIGLGLDPDADPSLTLSGAAAYPLTSNVAIEGELGHVFDMAPGDADVDSSLTTFHVSALYFFDTDYVFAPYVTAGVGVGKFSHDVRVPRFEIDSTEVGLNIGGGVTYPLSEAAFFRGELRYFKHIDNVPSVWRFSGGMSFRIGR